MVAPLGAFPSGVMSPRPRSLPRASRTVSVSSSQSMARVSVVGQARAVSTSAYTARMVSTYRAARSERPSGRAVETDIAHRIRLNGVRFTSPPDGEYASASHGIGGASRVFGPGHWLPVPTGSEYLFDPAHPRARVAVTIASVSRSVTEPRRLSSGRDEPGVRRTTTLSGQ